MKYTVRFFKGDYGSRQKAANAAGAVCYVEHHFNSAARSANYTVVVVADNASQQSKAWGRDYARRCAEAFGTALGGDVGLMVGGYGGRGNANLSQTAMPAILLEPLFCSNPDHAALIRTPAGQHRLARILADSIKTAFPNGGVVAFSVGHKYKTSAPNDRGAAVLGGGTEADCAEQVMLLAKQLLEAE